MADTNPFTSDAFCKRNAPRIIRNRWSNFFITVNTNKRFNPETLATNKEYLDLEQRLVEAFKILRSQENIWDYVTFKDHPRDEAINLTKSVTSMGRTEVGFEKKCLHIHGLIRFFHKTKLLLDIPKINKFFNQQLGISCYVNVRGSRDNTVDIENYINKYHTAIDQ